MKNNVKNKFVKALAFAIVSIVSAALVAWLKDPENRVFLQKRARAVKYALTEKIESVKSITLK